MNLDTKKALARVFAIFLLVLAIIGYRIVMEPAQTEEPQTTTQEPQPATEPTTIPEEEQEPAQTEEPPTDATEPTTPTETQPEIETTEPQPSTTETEQEGEWKSLGNFILTAYCACKNCCGKDPSSPNYGITATGVKAEAGTTIAVDPKAIRLGSKVKINGHTYIAQDTGGNIKKNRIDVFFDNHQEAIQFGAQKAEVFIQKS